MEDNGETKIKTKWLEITGKKTAELITIISLCVMAIIAYGFWEHKSDTKDTSMLLVEAIKELSKSQLNTVKEQRVMNCLLATKQDERRGMLSECERIAR